MSPARHQQRYRDPTVPTTTATTVAGLMHRWLRLHEEIKIHIANLKALTTAAAPQLGDRFGFGYDSGPEMLVTAGDGTDRTRFEAVFAKLCGACPTPTSSGETLGRHRLNR
jgi:transposase